MTVTEPHNQPVDLPPQDAALPPVPVAELVDSRLAQAALSGPVKALLKEALGGGEAQGASPAGRILSRSRLRDRTGGEGVPG